MKNSFSLVSSLALLALSASACVEINSNYTTALCNSDNSLASVPGLVDPALDAAKKATEYKIVRGYIGDEANRFYAMADATQTGPGAYRLDMTDGSKMIMKSCEIDGQIYLENANDDKTFRMFKFTTMTPGVEVEASLRLYDQATLDAHKIPYTKSGGSILIDNEKISASKLLGLSTNNAQYTDYVFKRFK